MEATDHGSYQIGCIRNLRGIGTQGRNVHDYFGSLFSRRNAVVVRTYRRKPTVVFWTDSPTPHDRRWK